MKLLPLGDKAKETARPDFMNASRSSGEPKGGYNGTGGRDDEDGSIGIADMSTSRDGIRTERGRRRAAQVGGCFPLLITRAQG